MRLQLAKIVRRHLDGSFVGFVVKNIQPVAGPVRCHADNDGGRAGWKNEFATHEAIFLFGHGGGGVPSLVV